MKTGILQQLWNMSVNTIKATGHTDLKLKVSERRLKEVVEDVHFYPPQMDSC